MSKTAMSTGIMLIVFIIVLVVVAFIIWKLAINHRIKTYEKIGRASCRERVSASV